MHHAIRRNSARRKSAPGVRAGRVQRKSHWGETPTYYNTPQRVPVIDRERPGAGFRHLLLKRDIVDFISILPDWSELSVGLNAILLARGNDDCDGYCQPGVVAVCAWPRDLWVEYNPHHFAVHRDIFERLGVPSERCGDGWRCKFSEASAKAYLLLHILTHELGHHHDRITTRSKREASRGEPYAEAYARRYEALIFDRYQDVFGILS